MVKEHYKLYRKALDESGSNVVILSFGAHGNCSEGVARIHYNMFLSLKSMKVKTCLVSVIDPSFENTFRNTLTGSTDSCELHLLKNTGGFLTAIASIVRVLSQHAPRYVVVGFHGIRPSIYLRFLKMVSRHNSSWKIVESLVSKPHRLLNRVRYSLPFTDKAFAYSPSVYAYLTSKVAYSKRKIFLIPPPIDTAHFSRKDGYQFLRSMGLDEVKEKLVIGYVGNLSKDRIDLAVVFKAISLISRKHDVVLLLVVPPYRGKTYRDVVNTYTNKFDLNKNVILIEKFINYSLRPQLYSSLDVFLHLYRHKEALFPFLTVLEALSVETPVITTMYNETLWVLGGVRYPFLMSSEEAADPSLLANLLEFFIKVREDGSELRTIMQSVKNRLVRNFSLESVGKILKKYLEDDDHK